MTFPIFLVLQAMDFPSELQCNSNPLCDLSSAFIKIAHLVDNDSSNGPIKAWQAWGRRLSHDAFWRGPTVPPTLTALQAVGSNNLAGLNIQHQLQIYAKECDTTKT